MTKKSTSTTIDRPTLAAELRHLADQLDTGLLETEEGSLPLGEPLFLKTKRKIKEDRAYLTFSCKISLTVPAAAKVGKTTRPPLQTTQRRPPEGAPPAAKIMKKEIARLWKEVTAGINAETQPAAAEMAKLRRLAADYRLYTPAAWADDWQACATAVGRCLDAAAANDFAAARRLVAEINEQTKNCHKRHK